MKMKNLLMKKALRAALFVLLLSVVGMTNLRAQNITFADSTYTANGMANGDQATMYRDYSDLPTFEYNGLTYVVAPDPQSSYSSFLSYSAAYSYCENLTLYGYSDWRMPTIEELEMMYLNRTSIGGFVEGSTYNLVFYHSSTYYDSSYGHYKLSWVNGQRVLNFVLENSGSAYIDYEGSRYYVYCHVRPIRVELVLPTVTTDNVTNITQTSATCGGNVTNNGGAALTEKGICWSTSPNPTIYNSHISYSNTYLGSFTSHMSNLTPGTQYYVRAYATNSEGTAYGNEVSFTTNSYGVPTVTTNSVYDITTTTAKGGGNVINNGGYALTERGICWSTNPNPTTYNSHISSNYTSLGSYTLSMTNLIPGTQYYVRAYASNSEGTAYGNEVTFTTTAPPTVTTNNVTNITPNSAICGGNVTNEGSATVTARGVCWSTNPNPTISNSHTNNGTGTGIFTSNITGLNQGTSYYVRAYATNSEGTSYGEEMYFTTTRWLDVTTNNVTYITQTSAICGGYVTAYNGATVTERGVCWSTSNQTPTISNSHTSNGTGTGSFTSNLTSLTQNTTYYVRAYATSSQGTVYGETKQFTTTKFEYRISEGGVVATSAGGYFYDSGGPDNDYGYNENYIMTFTSNQGAGTKIKMTFTQFYTDYHDAYLVIYDGLNTSAPVIGTYYYNHSPGTVTASNSEGALTFVFISGNSAFHTYEGWKAAISIVTPSYFIDVSANPGNGGTVSGGGYFDYGESCTLTATPASGYNFVRWTKNGTQVSTNPTYTFNVTGSASYVAHFQQQQSQSYAINVSANPTAGGTVSGGGTYNQGQSCTLTATPATGYNFVRWTKNGTQVSTNPTYTFTVTESASYVAHFSQNSYTITASANPSAGGTVIGTGSYNYGALCSLTATANNGYTFTNWTENGNVVSNSSNYTFNVYANHTLVANFQAQTPSPMFQVNAQYYPTSNDPNSEYVKVSWGEMVTTGIFESFESGDFSLYDWQNDPTYPWSITTINPYEGMYCMKSGGSGVGNVISNMTVTVNIPANGIMSFFGKISCEYSWDYGYFYIDGVQKGSYTGQSSWDEKTFDITAGIHTFQWRYTKDDSVNSNDDCFYVDYINFNRNAQPGWRTYSGEFNNAMGSNENNTLSWAYEYPASYLYTNYVGWQITKVSLFSDNQYSAVGGNYTCRIYVGGTEPASGTLVSSLTVDVPSNQNDWVTWDLTTPVNVTGNDPIWVVWTANSTVSNWPAGCSSGSNNYGNWWNAGNGNGWTHSSNSVWTMRQWFTNRPFEYFRVYRANCDGSGSMIIANYVTGDEYIDTDWSSLAAGNYKYGVCTSTAGSTDIYWSNCITKPVSYQIIASANPTTGGTVTGGGTYTLGTTCTLTATANNGYTFINWMKNGTVVSTSPSYSFTVTEAAIYVANFQQQQSQGYAINVSSNPTAGGTVSGDGTYNQGQSCTLTATPASGYTFVKWTKNGTRVSTSPTYTFTVTESATYVAHFRPQYTITATANPTNGGTVSGGGTYIHGQSCTMTAVPAAGYTFVKWTKNGTRVSTSPTYTFTVTESATYVAHFRPQYTITATANPTNGGTVSGGGTYIHGQRCTLTAVPAAGYTFVKWTKNGTKVSTNVTYTFTATESATYVAHFRPQYSIIARANPTNGGTVSGGGTYIHGQSCTLTAVPATGYTFVKWTKNGTRVSTNATYTFTATESATYVAYFRPQYTIIAMANPTNGGTVSGDGTYIHGQRCTLTATANTGYTFVNWKENGSVVSTNTSYSFTVTGARTLVANFEGNPAPVNIAFADANVKALCIANWDTNGDGELNYAEAAAVTDLGTVFKDNDNITTFNELQYFTGLTFIGERAFYNCEGLTSIVVPNSVTTLNQYAFAFCYYLTSVGLSNSLTTIGNYAFESCSRLNSINIPNTVMTIGNSAFYDCSGLVSLEIPASVTSIGNYAFCYCTGLEQITVAAGNGVFDSRNNCNAIIETSTNTLRFGCKNSFIPNTVTALGNNAFLEMDVTSVHIPKSVVTIGTKVFGGCSLLAQITVAQNNPVFDSRNDCNAIVETSTNKLVVGCKNTVIPNTITTIGDYAFYNCEGLTSIVVPNSVTTLNQYAFAFCYHLISVEMSNSLTTIGNYAFESCSRLNSINIPNTVTTIGNWAFYDCSGLVSLDIPASVISIGNYAFSYCTKLTHIISWANNPPALGNNVFVGVDKSIPVYVSAGRISIYQAVYGWNEFTNYQEITNNGENIFFADVNVKALCVANWDINGDGELSYSEAAVVTNLGEVFKNNTTIISFNELQYFTGLTTIGEDAFRGCENLSLVTIPNFVNSIGDYAFRGCYDLTSIVIPNSVIVIGNYAFYSCFDLVLVTIGNSVIFIGNYAFSWCSDLSSMSVLAETPPSLSNGAFNYVDKSIPVYVPCGSMAAYQSSAYWNEFTNIQEDCTRLLSEDWNQIGYPVITQESLSTEQTNFVTNRVLSLYPNPTERNTVFTLDIPSEEIIVEVFVCNAFGAVVLHETGVQVGRHMQSIAVSGVYIVKAICKSGNLYVGKLIVK